MTSIDARTPAARPAARPARKPRPNGQWLVDGTEPLNRNEEIKQEGPPLEVRERIETVYAQGGFASIDPDDLRGRFRWWGLYTQRKPGIDGGRTATLEPHELDDEYFMLRIRLDGGQLSTKQLNVIGAISTEFGRDSADITDRQNIQLHWIRVEDMPEIWRRLEAVGLTTAEACGDCPRVILGSPVAGVAADELIDVTETIERIREAWIGDPSLANLPRKYKTALTGHPSLDVVHEINDISFVAVDHPEHGIGFDLWVGGGLSTSAHLAERLNTFVTPEDAPRVWHAVTSVFRDYGYRRLRNRARLKYLMADWGPEKFRQVLEEEYLGGKLPDSVPPPTPVTSGDHVGVHRQKDGRYYIGAAPTVGRVSGTVLTNLANLARRHGSGRIRLTPHQKLLVLDVKEEAIGYIRAGLERNGLSVKPSLFRRHTIACTGLEYCKLAITDTKDTATETIATLEERLGDLEGLPPISLHVNGCPNSCARIQTADIGLKGQIVTTDDGVQQPGFQVHLGGGLVNDFREQADLGRTIRGLKVASADLPDYVETLVNRFRDQRSEGETFAQWAWRVEEEQLV